MDGWIKQSTAHTFQMGPFLDDTDGKTAEAALTIAAADVFVSKHGAAFAAKNDATAMTGTGDARGYYDCVLNTTDTGTVGSLKVCVHVAGALPVWSTFMVLPANSWDSLVGGTDNLQVHAAEITAGLITAAAIADGAIDAATFAAGAINAAAIADAAIDFATFAADCITGTGLKANVESITAGAITAAAVATGAIDADALGADCITSAKIADNAIAAEHLANNAIDFATFAADCKTGTGLKANVESVTNDAITAASIAANAIDLATFAADCKTGSALKANVETITANAITATSIATDAITAVKIAADSVVKITNGNAIETGTAQGNVDANVIVLAAAGPSATDDFYNGCLVSIQSGTGHGQARLIVDYTGATKTATVDRAWVTIPIADSVYRIYPFSGILLADTGVATAVGAATITLAATAPGVADSFIGHTVYICGGTGVGQARIITAYTAGRQCTVSPAWTTSLGADTIYKILPVGRVYVNAIAAGAIDAASIADAAIDFATFAADCKTGTGLKANVESISAGAITAAAIATGAIDADALATDAVDEIWQRHTPVTGIDLELAIDRIYEILNNPIIVTEATGAVQLRNVADAADVATGNVQDLGATTKRTTLTWA